MKIQDILAKNEKVYKRPDDLVIDGQQRLTALLAAMYGVTIKDQNYEERKNQNLFQSSDVRICRLDNRRMNAIQNKQEMPAVPRD